MVNIGPLHRTSRKCPEMGSDWADMLGAHNCIAEQRVRAVLAELSAPGFARALGIAARPQCQNFDHFATIC